MGKFTRNRVDSPEYDEPQQSSTWFITNLSSDWEQFWPRQAILVLTHTNKIVHACRRDFGVTGNEIPTIKDDFFLTNHTPVHQNFSEIQNGSERFFS